MGITTTTDLGLSPAQKMFALEHCARVGMDAANSEPGVFLYRDDDWATYRWLVDPAGRTLDFATFHKAPRSGFADHADERRPCSGSEAGR